LPVIDPLMLNDHFLDVFLSNYDFSEFSLLC
jgi:hypothetical protein